MSAFLVGLLDRAPEYQIRLILTRVQITLDRRTDAPAFAREAPAASGPGIGFHSLVAILRNPGLRPYMEGGVQRNCSWNSVGSYSENWWCSDWASADNGALFEGSSIAFLTPAARADGQQETKQLLALGSARVHPNDADVPEMLYLALRIIRYGCTRATAPTTTRTIHT